MNPRCDTLLDEIKKKGKLSEDDLLQLCEEYDLFPNEVDWITDKALECHCLALSDYRTPKSSFNRDMEPSLLQLPDWMVDIPDKYFSNRQDLCHIILPKGIKSVGNYVAVYNFSSHSRKSRLWKFSPLQATSGNYFSG